MKRTVFAALLTITSIHVTSAFIGGQNAQKPDRQVSAGINPLYYRLITAFDNQTGVPILLNTSFNENEPIVNTPAEALDCFLRTSMDRLVMGNVVVKRNG